MDIPEGDELYQYWKNDDRVEIIHFLDDIGQPYTCPQWGNQGDIGIPPIIDDGSGFTVFDWFENPSTPAAYPLFIFIDHTMKIINITDTSPNILANATIEAMLDNMPPPMSIFADDEQTFINNFFISRLFPNPFNPVLNINIDMKWAGVIHVDILDVSGVYIETLYSGFLYSGSHDMKWNAESMPSGVYLVSLKSGDQSHTKKVVLLK